MKHGNLGTMPRTPRALVICGPPGSGKTTVGRLVAAQLGAAMLDLDTATADLVEVIAVLGGGSNLDDPAFADLTRSARYATLRHLAHDSLDAGVDVVLIAPFSAERRDLVAWGRLHDDLAAHGAIVTMVWIRLSANEVQARVAQRGAVRDAAKEDGIRDCVAACDAEGVLLIVELLTYRLDGESEADYQAAFPGFIEEGTKLAIACGAKVLKLPYPGSAEACDAVTIAADGAPWAVLSAGVDHETFIEQVRTAIAHGASGALAGLSLWKNSLAVSPETRRDLLGARALPRLNELAAAVDAPRP